MLKKRIFFFLIFTPLFQSYSNDLTEIKKNLLTDLFDSIPVEQKKTWAKKEISEWKALQREDGSFKDLDYLDSQNMNWGPLNTLNRALVMAMATKMKEHDLYSNQEILNRSLESIDFITRQKWWHYNWWHMEIGLPLTTYKMILLLERELSSSQLRVLMSMTLKGHLVTHPSSWPATGQNKIWYSEITLALGVIYQNSEWIQLALQSVSTELTKNNSAGIQEDNGFYQHGPLFYSGGYGLAFSKDTARFFKFILNTSFRFTKENYQVLSEYILNGQLWLVHGRTIDYSSMGRNYCRIGAADASVFKSICDILAKTSGVYQSEFKKCSEFFDQSSLNVKVGNRYFWKSDFMTHNLMNSAISVRMNSNRTLNGDTSPGGEGLKSHHLANGLTHIYQTGQEYSNIHPIWDFKRLPGVTTEYEFPYPAVIDHNYIPHYGSTPFAGGVSDFSSGVSAMIFEENSLKANKSWFFYDQGMVALGSGIRSNGSKPVLTGVNQEWSQSSDIEYGSLQAQSPSLKLGSEPVHLINSHWVYANQKGYVIYPNSNDSMVLQNVIQKGSWKQIAVQLSDKEIGGKVTSLWLKHENLQVGSKYHYSVYPNISKSELIQKSKTPSYEVIEHSNQAHAIWFNSEKKLQAVFFEAGKLQWQSFSLKSNKPLLVIYSQGQGKLTVASPVHDSGVVNLEFCRTTSSCITHRVQLPGGNKAGSSLELSI